MRTATRAEAARNGTTLNRTDDFAVRFADYWRQPDTEQLGHLLSEDVRLVQPLSPPTEGLEAARREFGKLFRWLPDLHAEVDRWRGEGDTVFIEFRLIATIAGKPFSWPAVDRFTLRGDKACERVSYFDGVAVATHLLKHPSEWPGWMRSRLG